MRSIIVVSDLHVGSTVGLWPEKFQIEGGGYVEGNKYQAWLLRCWVDLLDHVRRLAESPVLVINGDVVQGVSSRDGQLITNRVDIQAHAAQDLLQPLVDKCNAVYCIRGTEWHEGKASEFVEQLARSLGSVQHHSTGQYTRWELRIDVAGRVIHFAHHIQSTSVPWYEATVPLREAEMYQAELVRFFGTEAPNVAMLVRSHRHRYIQVHAPPDLKVLVTPGWQLRTAFAYKKATAMLPEIGFVEIESDEKGRLQAIPHIYPLPTLHVETLK